MSSPSGSTWGGAPLARSLACGATLAALLGGCYAGAARSFRPAAFAGEPGWISVEAVTAIHQGGARDCGAAVVAILLAYWGVPASQTDVRAASGVPAERGLPAGFLRGYLRARGMQAFLVEGTIDDLAHELEGRRPVLVGVNKRYSNRVDAHYLIVVGLHRARRLVVVIDPADGWRQYSFDGFAREWSSTRNLAIVAFPLQER
jgi:ABC-type bacteriocin/lantibiotic exporter with double-glycine peptidase domain